MKFLLIGLLSATMLTALSARAAETVSFEKIADLVRAKNPLVEASRKNKEAKQYREGFLTRSFLPEISAEIAQESFLLGTEDRKTQSTWKVQAELNLFRGGSDYLEEKVRTLESGVADLEVQVVSKEELQKAYELYWNLVFKQDVLKTLNNHLELSKKNLGDANRRISAGVATSTDRLEFEMKVSLIKQDIALAEKDIRVLSNQLGLALGLKTPTLPQSALNHFHDWESGLKPLQPSELAELKLALNEKEALKAKGDQYRGNYLPAVDLYAGYAEPNQREERDFPSVADRKESYVGIKASWSLGRAIDASVERGALKRELGAKELRANQLSDQLQIWQDSQFDELKTLHSFVHDSEENIKISYRYLEATLKEYSRGVKNSPDVLEATEKYINAKVRLAEIIRDFNVLYSSQLALRM